MPELPEVETTVRAISSFKNKKLEKVIIHNRNLRWKIEKDLEDLSANKKNLKYFKKGKIYIDAT